MDILFFCNTNMQLINAIQIKLELKSNSNADIIISDHSIGFKEVANRLKELHIFRRVHYVETYEYAHGQSVLEDIKDVFSVCFGGAKKYRSLMWEEIPDYDEMYFYNYEFLAQVVYDEMLKRGKHTKVYRYEETLTSYQNLAKTINGGYNPGGRVKVFIKYCKFTHKKFLNSDNCLFGDFVYLPEIYRKYVPSTYPIMQLPMLTRENSELKNILNSIYDYDPAFNQIKQKYIYLAGSYDIDGYSVNEAEIILKISEIVGKENLVVKMHPRDRRTVYEDLGIGVNRLSSVPWELVLLNQDFSNHIFLSLNSGSMITGPAVIGGKYVGLYLYPLLNSDKLDANVTEMINGVDKILSQLHEIGKAKGCKKISDLNQIPM